VKTPPESVAPDGGSQDEHADEGADQHQTRERDLMRELDQVTGRKAETRAARHSSPNPRTARRHPERAEEVSDE
jgi:hypothetical protein